MSVIETRDLSKRFQITVKKPGIGNALKAFFSKEHRNVDAVQNLSFKIEKGELVGFLGPNGAGKTTTLKLLSGLLYPTSGTMEVLGRMPWKRETEFLMKFSMVMGQRTQLWWDLPPRDTYRLNQKIYEVPDPAFKEMLEELTLLLELEEILDKPVKKLSLGERMKAELACALLHRPEVLLLDEPTLGLDVVMQKKLRSFIRDYNKKYSATILLTSHNMTDVEELCKRVMIIDGGRLLFDGSLEEIVEKYAPDKLVSLSTSNKIAPEDLSGYGRIVSMNGNSIKLEIPRRKIPEAMQNLLSRVPVVDLTIEELPVEEIIRRVFSKEE